MLSTDVLQSPSSLKTRRLIDDVQDGVIFDVHDVHYYGKIKIDVNLQGEFETSRGFSMFLTKGAEFGEFFQCRFSIS